MDDPEKKGGSGQGSRISFALVRSGGLLSILGDGLQAPEFLDSAGAAHSGADDVAIGADHAVGTGADVEAPIIIERRAVAVELGADPAVVAAQQVDARFAR